MMTQHTHGPWSYEVHELSEGYSAIVYDERGHAIADHLAEDRARLIAAAPELLAALELTLPIISDRAAGGRMLTPHQHAADVFQKIKALIAKATAGGAA